jgi:hypothetical protein
MHHLADRNEQTLPWLEYGEVAAEAVTDFTVCTSFGAVKARAAAGCLVRPQTGDRVLISTDGDAESYVLSVLERAAGLESPTRLEFHGDVDIHAQNGGLSLTADRDVIVASEDRLALASRKLSVHASVGEAVIERVSLTGRMLRSRIRRIRTVAGSVEQTVRRLTQRLQDSFRYVEDQDEVQCKNARHLVEDTLTVQSRNAVHMAEEVVTINAEQVHLG